MLDEKDARKRAELLGLKVLGTIGILIWAKRSRHIKSLKAQLDALQQKAKFRISPSLYQKALREANE